ncbi:pentapeptide repeat-containing protein [Streptomyces virginiae]|uniref:pentapeptide repeat-containing protein n=1 Tax=Streptomyces virginiae TaxID=1961 RepID=UPI003716E181
MPRGWRVPKPCRPGCRRSRRADARRADARRADARRADARRADARRADVRRADVRGSIRPAAGGSWRCLGVSAPQPHSCRRLLQRA